MSEHKTKEEILSEITGWGIHDLEHYPHKCKIKAETALQAMQLYADQQTSLLTQQLSEKDKEIEKLNKLSDENDMLRKFYKELERKFHKVSDEKKEFYAILNDPDRLDAWIAGSY